MCLLRGTDWIFVGSWLDNSWTRFQLGPCGTGGGQSDAGTFVCLNTLRHVLVSKVAGWIPSGVIGSFHCHSPSSCTMAMGSTQISNVNEYQEYFLGGKDGWCVGLTTLPPSYVDCHETRKPQPPVILRAVQGLLFTPASVIR